MLKPEIVEIQGVKMLQMFRPYEDEEHMEKIVGNFLKKYTDIKGWDRDEYTLSDLNEKFFMPQGFQILNIPEKNLLALYIKV